VRLFAGDRIKNIMQRFKVPDDEPMEASILSKQIENAQKKVEEQNFVMRKNVLKYDDVMNTQRQVIYAQRRRVLDGQDMSEEIRGWIDGVVENAVDTYTQAEYGEEWDLGALTQAMHDLYGSDITPEELKEEVSLERDALVEEFQQDARDAYGDKEQELGVELMRDLERYVTLQVVDTRWREHLENMDYLREGVHLRAFAQKDPLVEYRGEGHRMFEELGLQIREEVVGTLFHAQLAPQDAELLEQPGQQNGDRLAYEHETAAGAGAIAGAAVGGGSVATAGATAPAQTVNTQQVVKNENQQLGRNDPCWCGSGKKFKKCHGG
jgi:preprotein translocase subunit SecA